MRFFLLCILLLISTIAFAGQGMMPGPGFKTYSGGSPTVITDDFSNGFADWTNPFGTGATYTIVSEHLESPAASGVIIHDTETDTVSQYMSAKILEDAQWHNGFIFRNDGTADNYSYAARFPTQTSVMFRFCNGTGQYTCTTVDERTIGSMDAGDFVGVKISGTGVEPTVTWYLWNTGSYSSVPPIATWDADNSDSVEFVTGSGRTGSAITTGTKADTGKRLGFYNGSTNSQEWDDFEAGSF
jgi:hypothetical protein